MSSEAEHESMTESRRVTDGQNSSSTSDSSMDGDTAQWECRRYGYVLRGTLGTGSFGVVRLAVMIDNRRMVEDGKIKGHEMVAIKILHKRALQQKETDKHFVQKALKREVEILHRLDHPHVIYLFDYFETPDRKYLVLEYAQEGQLSVFVRRYRVGRGVGLPENVACRFTKQLVDGLQYVHRQGIVHRDLKDENILLDRKFNVKISDFGFATELTKGYMRDYGPMKRLETFCGSMEYMAPEILRSEPYHGVLADIWSLGVVFYTMLAGVRPYNVPTNLDKEVRREMLLQKMEEPLDFSRSIHLSEDAKYLARNILQVDKKRRPSLKRISAYSWMRGAYAWEGTVLENVQEFREHYQDLGSDTWSSCNAENIRQVDDEEAAKSSEGETPSSDVDSFSSLVVPGLDSDLDGRKAPSPSYITPGELSQDEPMDASANSPNGRHPRRRRQRARLDKTSGGNVSKEPTYVEAKQLKKKFHDKMESPDQKQRRGAKRNTKQNRRKPETRKAKEKDATVTTTDRQVSEKGSNKQSKPSDDGTKGKIEMAPSSDGQGNHVSSENRTSIKRRAPRRQRTKQLAENNVHKERDEPSAEDHATVTRKDRGNTLKKKTKRLGDGKRFQTKKPPFRTAIISPVHISAEAPIRTAVESVQADYEYSDDFEEDSEETASSLKDRDFKTGGDQLIAKRDDKVQRREKPVLKKREERPQNTTTKNKRAVKTALSSIKKDSPSTKQATGRQHWSAKARVVQEVGSDHASPFYSKQRDASPERLSPPPEMLIKIVDENIEEQISDGDVSSFDLEEKEAPPCAAVPLKVERGSADRVCAVTKSSKKGARLTGKRSEGAAVGRRNIHTRDRKVRKKFGSHRGNRVEKVRVGGMLPPIDANWKAGQLVGQVPSTDTKPAGDVQRLGHTPHPRTGKIQMRKRSPGDSGGNERNRLIDFQP
ncbi:MARK4 [Branchiostoma lanceolatum]|uniref:MARK4 protein n=1 Tax=Branchiostoma lanceolatum TaxID=7740 RepID=A0A8K0A328_BRALA|nr:MARK4 [Branchiostoma lanceolatum]